MVALPLEFAMEATALGEPVTAKLFTHDHRQAVELPDGFELPGAEVRLTRVGDGVLIEPVEVATRRSADDLDHWLDEIQALTGGQFMIEGRQQPPMPDDEDMFD